MPNTTKRPPYAPPPHAGPEVLGEAAWERQQQAYSLYQRWLREHPDDFAPGDPDAPVVQDAGAAEPDAPQRWIFIATIQDSLGNEREFRKRDIQSQFRENALATGRRAAGEDCSPDERVVSYRITKPRGKPFQQGTDSRRKQEQGGSADGGSDDGGDAGNQQDSGNDQKNGGKKDGGGQAQQQAQDPTLRDFARSLTQAQNKAAQKGGGEESFNQFPDLMLMRKLSPVLEGWEALQALSQITVGTVEPIFAEVAKAIHALDAKPGADPEKIKTLALEALRDAMERMALDPDQTTMADGKTLRETIEEIAGEVAPKLPDVPTETQVVKVREPKLTGPAALPEAEGDRFQIGRRVHDKAQDVVDLLQGGQNVLLIGPTGCGKTVLARDVADILRTRFGSVSITAGVSEGALIGRHLPHGKAGEWGYVGTLFVDFYEQGGLWLFDELDSADPNAMLIVNQALSNGSLPLPPRIENPVAARADGNGQHGPFRCIAAANTYGTGANRMYVGRNQLDDATLDRFRIGQVEMDYDRALEAALVPDAAWLDRMWQIRAAINDKRLRRNLSTRFIVQSWQMHQAAGWTIGKCLTRLTAGWSHDELTKVGLGK